jgi:hypothetical protein
VADGDKGLRLEDWIGKRVTVNILRNPTREPDEHGPILGVEGFLEGVDPMGVIVLSSPRDVYGRRGMVAPQTELKPRHVFYPWQRVDLIERIEGEPG